MLASGYNTKGNINQSVRNYAAVVVAPTFHENPSTTFVQRL